MSCLPLEDIRQAAVRAVREACAVTELVRSELKASDKMVKKDTSPVTVADFASQAILILLLKAQFRTIGFVAEETATDLRKPESRVLTERIVAFVRKCSLLQTVTEMEVLDAIDSGNYFQSSTAPGREQQAFFCIDPIDGTKGFLRNEQYAVCLGLVQCDATTRLGVPILGVLGCPCLPEQLHLDALTSSARTVSNTHSSASEPRGVIIHACTGRGVAASWWQNHDADLPHDRGDRAIANRNGAGDILMHRKSAAVDCFVESVEPKSTDQSFSARVAAAVGIQSKQPLRLDSQAKYVAIARGDAAVYLRLASNYPHCIWDHAAGACIVTEAGGKVSDALGNELDFAAGAILIRNSGGIVAVSGCAENPNLHNEVIAAIAKLRDDE